MVSPEDPRRHSPFKVVIVNHGLQKSCYIFWAEVLAICKHIKYKKHVVVSNSEMLKSITDDISNTKQQKSNHSNHYTAAREEHVEEYLIFRW